MDILADYDDSDNEGGKPIRKVLQPPVVKPDSAATETITSLPIKSTGMEMAPAVLTKSAIQTIPVADISKKELSYNPKFEELFQPEAGPSNPFKSARQVAQKNTLAGYVEPAHVNAFHFEREIRCFDTLGYARNPTADGNNDFVGENKAEAKKNDGASLFDVKKTGGQKRKRVYNYDAGDVEGYTGPWANYVDQVLVSQPDEALQKEMDEIVKKRQKNSKKGMRKAMEEQGNVEETSTFHLKESTDYQGRSFLHVPTFTGVNLKEDYIPDRCYIPKKQIHTYKGHNKGVNHVKWFPKSAHLFLSCAMDCKVKLWEVYGKQNIVRTYSGHRMPVRDIAFDWDGHAFASGSFDRFIKLWDTETGQVKQRLTNGHPPVCLKFHPDEDKRYMLMGGMQNKKIVQWDVRSGDVVQEYDRHLGPVNTITFFDKNRRFVSTSDDKSLRIWEWEIPVDTKLIQNVGLQSIPSMTKSPTDKWIIGQSMDNRIVLFQLIDDKLRFARKKAFRGHNAAGYACQIDFSPDMSFVTSGDADGKIFIWDWRTHKVVARWKAHSQTCISVQWHPHEKSKMISASWDGDIKMWN
ncbi:unnamed protein product, partial [Mesorhabditis spiculigera]